MRYSLVGRGGKGGVTDKRPQGPVTEVVVVRVAGNFVLGGVGEMFAGAFAGAGGYPTLGTRSVAGGERVRYIMYVIILIMVVVTNIVKVFKKIFVVASKPFAGGGGG